MQSSGDQLNRLLLSIPWVSHHRDRPTWLTSSTVQEGCCTPRRAQLCHIGRYFPQKQPLPRGSNVHLSPAHPRCNSLKDRFSWAQNDRPSMNQQGHWPNHSLHPPPTAWGFFPWTHPQGLGWKTRALKSSAKISKHNTVVPRFSNGICSGRPFKF